MKIGRGQGFHVLDGDSEFFYKSRFGTELPFIHTATCADLAGVFVGHANQPLTLERFGIRFWWASEAKGIDVFKCLSESTDQDLADGSKAFNVGWERDSLSAQDHVQ
ncbi:hypothetical protein D3C85_1161780 [compost metagenome]